MKFKITIIFLLLFSASAWAISPADYCAKKPGVACELLTVDMISGGGADTERYTVIKKVCVNGSFEIKNIIFYII